MPIVNLISTQGQRTFKAEISLYAIPNILVQQYDKREAFKPIKNLSQILTRVCEYYNFDFTRVVSKCRKREHVCARQVYCYIAAHTTGESLESIGAIIGARDHTTVIHSHRTVQDMIDTNNPMYKDCIQAIAPYLLGSRRNYNWKKKNADQ